MPRKILHIHDRTLKQAMSDPRVAEDFLKSYLPLDIQQKVNFSTLQLQKESYIDEALKLLITDVLYSVELNTRSGSKALIYFLIEHFLKPNKLTPWITLKYSCQIIDQALKKTQSEELPLIIPIVVYNGQAKYPYSESIYDLFAEEEKALAKKYMFHCFQLIDFSQIPDETMQTHEWSVLMEILLKHAHSRDIMNKLEDLKHHIVTLANKNADNYILGMLKYAIECLEIQDSERFTTFLQTTLPKPLEAKTMTLAQQWQDQGFKQGMQQGERAVVNKLLLRRFSSVPAKYANILDHSDPDKLLAIGERILDAKTIDEIFEQKDE